MSADLAVSQIFEDFVKCVENKEIVCSIFLNLKKAFDTVNHQILLCKSQRYGIRGLPLSLLKSYLCDRQQCVVAL